MPVHAAEGDVEKAIGKPAHIARGEVALEANLRRTDPLQGRGLPAPKLFGLGEALGVQQLTLSQTGSECRARRG
jgi:hypothetical protein